MFILEGVLDWCNGCFKVCVYAFVKYFFVDFPSEPFSGDDDLFFEDAGVVHESRVFDVCCVVSEVCHAPTFVAKRMKGPYRVERGGVHIAEVLLEGLVEVVGVVVPSFGGFSEGGSL